MGKPTHIVIVGGGAGGLELATQLGNTLGKKQLVTITLVDVNLVHIWKPLWHEVAAGTLTSSEDQVSYIAHAYHHHFQFQLGRLIGLDRKKKEIILAEVKDHSGEQILPERTLAYDILVIAIGSVSHDFNVPGVNENCFFLDQYADCQLLHHVLLKNLIRLQEHIQSELTIAIVGGGATGVELAAELHFACNQALYYKHEKTHQLPGVQINIIESYPRLLPPLPEKIASITQQELVRRGIKVWLGEQVTRVDNEQIYTKSGLCIPAILKLWAAGIKAPDILRTLDLETSSRNQIIVRQTLQSTCDDHIFAFGDCAYCPQPGSDKPVPPRAQAAHQQALLLAKSLARYIQGKPLLPYFYRDYGSLITLSQSYTLGNLMGRAIGNVMLEGKLAHIAYLFLYRRHLAALYGWWRVALLTLAQLLTRTIKPRLKLH